MTVIVLTCDKCGYERTSEEDGQIFVERGDVLICQDCWSTCEEHRGQVN